MFSFRNFEPSYFINKIAISELNTSQVFYFSSY